MTKSRTSPSKGLCKLEDFQYYFAREEEIDTFLTAALWPEAISYTSFTDKSLISAMLHKADEDAGQGSANGTENCSAGYEKAITPE